MLLSMYHSDIAITIYGWFGGHAETCLGVACFVGGGGGDMYVTPLPLLYHYDTYLITYTTTMCPKI